MRSVLVCVRAPAAAQSIGSCAVRLGAAGVRTALSETEVMARLAERPVELILADTLAVRPDVVGFTRRVMAASPRTVLVLFGVEEPRIAAAAVAAGARGLIRGTDHDPVTTVTKALLLIGSATRGTAGAVPGASAGPVGEATASRARVVRPGPGPVGEPAIRRPGVADTAPAATGRGTRSGPGGPPGAPVTTGPGMAMVPAQRTDVTTPPEPAGPASRQGRLTEREQQVLRGMAEGKSNAEIGKDLYVSEDTVKTHARRLFRKLGARDRAHAVAVGFRSGVLG